MQSQNVLNRMPTRLLTVWKGFPVWFWALLGLLTLAQLWLAGHHAFPAMVSGADDELYLNLARNLAAGRWLGDYNEATLLKQPFYSMWIAAMFWLGIPLSLSQHLLYAAACMVCVVALGPLTRGGKAAVAFIYVILLFHPVGYPPSVGTRVLREGIYPALTLFVVSCALGVLLRHKEPLKTLVRWNTALGLALAAFWLTREEGIWLLPTVALLLAWPFCSFASSARISAKPLLSLLIPVAITVSLVLLVCTANKLHYGVFTTNEQLQADFTSAVSALQRVKSERYTRYLDVPREKRERIYAVSPAFAELRETLEGQPGRNWASFGAHAGMDISKSHFQFALRDAVARAGHYASGDKAARYYRRLASEINAACENGQLECSGKGMLPFLQAAYLGDVLHAELFEPFVATFAGTLRSAVIFPTFSVRRLKQQEAPDNVKALFRDLTRDRISNDGLTLKAQGMVDALKMAVLNQLLDGFRILNLLLLAPALALYLFDVFRLVLRPRVGRLSPALVITTALLGAVLARTCIVTLMTVTVDPDFGHFGLYQLAMLPLVTLFSLLAYSRWFPNQIR